MKSLLPFFLCCLLTESIQAQQVFTLELLCTDRPGIIQKMPYKKAFTDTVQRDEEVRKVIYELYSDGFLTASVDSSFTSGTNRNVFIYAGEVYQWVELRKGNVSEQLINRSGFKEKFFRNKPFRSGELRDLLEDLIGVAENSGYPFASVQLDSVKLSGSGITAALNMSLNRLFIIDSIHLHGKRVIAPVYLESYLGIRPGDIYNEQKIKQVSARLRELPFLSEQRPYELFFQRDRVSLHLYPERKNANQFDGLLGFLPRDDRPGEVRLGGQAHLKLLNALKRGELLDVYIQNLSARTQEMRARFSYPYIFSTPVGIDLMLSIYKQDTTYLDVNREAGIQYFFTGLNYFKVFIRNKTSSLISDGVLKTAVELPPYADISSTFYGIGYRTEKLDYRFNPRKGWTFNAEAGAGIRQIKPNAVNEALYDSIELKTTQYKLEAEAGIFIPLSKKQVLHTLLASGVLTGNELFVNELYRLGGIHRLRGFDEGSILASAYISGTLEYRYLLEQNSYFFAFFDQASYRSRKRAGQISDTPSGFGAGISFETKAGIFSLSYALGKQFKNPLNLQTGKIHFGVISHF